MTDPPVMACHILVLYMYHCWKREKELYKGNKENKAQLFRCAFEVVDGCCIGDAEGVSRCFMGKVYILRQQNTPSSCMKTGRPATSR